jgi:hypothetical protein
VLRCKKSDFFSNISLILRSYATINNGKYWNNKLGDGGTPMWEISNDRRCRLHMVWGPMGLVWLLKSLLSRRKEVLPVRRGGWFLVDCSWQSCTKRQAACGFSVTRASLQNATESDVNRNRRHHLIATQTFYSSPATPVAPGIETVRRSNRRTCSAIIFWKF